MLITILIAALIIFDAVLLVMYMKKDKKSTDALAVLKEVHREKTELTRLKDQLKAELAEQKDQHRQQMTKITAIAAEMDMDVQTFKDTIGQDLDQMLSNFTGKCEEQQSKARKHNFALEAMIKSCDEQHKLLLRSIKRAERLTKFFAKDLPYEDIIADLTTKKYQDARAMMTSGVPAQQVARELGLTDSELQVMAKAR